MKYILPIILGFTLILGVCNKTSSPPEKQKTKITKKVTKEKCKILHSRTTDNARVDFVTGCWEEGSTYVHMVCIFIAGSQKAAARDALAVMYAFLGKIYPTTLVFGKCYNIKGKKVCMAVHRVTKE